MTVRITRDTALDPGDEAALRAAAEAALEHGGRPGIDVDVILVDDELLTALHGRFLGDASPTDVIAFDLGDPEAPDAPGRGTSPSAGPVGEVYVSVECAWRTARERGVEPGRELALYVVHGALHLCGHDDHAGPDRERMREAERAVLSSLGYPDDPLPHDEA